MTVWHNIIIKNWYPLPLISELLDWLGQAKRFIELDLINAYYRMRICESDQWKTAFWTQYGYFEYQVIFFGFFNILATFQGYINKILIEKLDVFVIVYLDEILIYIKNPNQPHVEVIC